MAYISLFFTALIAATLIPAQSETVLAALLLTQRYSTMGLITVASIGNILGSVINYTLGRGIECFKDKTWFPVRDKHLEHASHWYSRYGRWSLLLSWMPFIGDPLTIVAGVLREKFIVFLTFITIAKTGRYLFIAAVVTRLFD